MLRHKHIDRICCIVLVLTLLLTAVFVGAADAGVITADRTMGYEDRLFDQSRVHTLDIVMDDWENFLDSCTSEVYYACDITIDGERYANVAIRGKGNTSLSSVRSYGNDRYSFKVEFDRYQSGLTYHGLDKLSLNNLIYDHTYMKDYWSFTLMNKMGVASSLCSFVQINVNGEPWGLYLAVEGVEDAFLRRNYGQADGELYKPDAMSMGGGRGNGRDFDMENFAGENGFSFDGGEREQAPSFPGGDDVGASFGGSSGRSGSGDGDASSGSSGGQSAAPADRGSSRAPGDSMPTPPADGGSFEMPADFDFSSFGGNGGGPGGGFGGMFGGSDVNLQYIDDDPSSYSNIFNNAKTDVTDTDKARLIASLKALSEGDTSVVDRDMVIRYMAVHNFLCNDDSYTGMMVHNYYLYEEDGVLSMIPWDYNLAFGGFSASSNGTSTVNTAIDTLVSGMGGGDRPMADWIMNDEEAMDEYHAFYQQFMDEVFHSGWFEAEFDRVVAMISPYVQKDREPFCTYEEFQEAATILKQFCLKRAESVSGQLAGTIPSTSSAQRSSNALVDASDVDLTAMGSMNGGFGGGRDRSSRSEAGGAEQTNRPDMGSFTMPTDGAMPEMPAEGEMPDMSGFGDSFGGSSGEAAADGETAVPAVSDAPKAPAEGNAERPARTERNESMEQNEGAKRNESVERNDGTERTRPAGGFSTSGMTRQDSSQSISGESLRWLGGCAGLLLAAILFAAGKRKWH